MAEPLTLTLAGDRRRGICLRDVQSEASDPIAAVAATAGLGASLLHLPSVTAVSSTLDANELQHTRALAADAGVGLSAGLPAVHPDRVTAAWGTDRLSPGHPFAQIAAAEALGVESLHVTVGQDDDRFRSAPSWADQLERTVPVLAQLVDRADVPVVLKTHEEMTTFELAELVRAVPGLRVGFSPVNLVARLEDPVAGARRIAPLVHTVFVDDCALVRTRSGLTRVMRPIGAGSIDWRTLFAALPINAPMVIDLHRAQLSMPVYDPAWLAHQPDLTPAELADVYALSTARASEATVEERTAVAATLLTAAAAASGAAPRVPQLIGGGGHAPLD